jgi:uncharacterized protein
MGDFKRNPVFWLMWAIPGAAVLAGTSMVALAFKDADRTLPDIYHWEGERLDADFERARHAARHGMAATLELSGGVCTVSMANAPQEADSLQLRLTNGNDAHLDRALTLSRVAAGRYRAPCVALPAGRWRVALSDQANTWALRESVEGPFERLDIRARDPEGAGG